jgi:MoaA/NifB/PqqE/SkfB family radical SAM enzyme
MLHLLGRCNLTCVHCYMDGSPSRREQLALDAVVAAVEDSDALGIGTLYLTGGEPLLYKGLSEVLNTVSQTPALETTLCTNATLINERFTSMIKACGARVNVSMDGDEDFHDRFRNLHGAFRNAARGIRLLVEAGISVTIVTTISQCNLHQLSRIAAWAAEAGAVKFRVQPLLKLGRAVEIAEQRLTSSQLNQLILQLSDLAHTYGPSGLDCSLIGVTRRFLVTHPCGAYVCNGTGCHRRVAKEIKKLVVREDGTILPEVTNLSHNFALGNLADAPMSTLVARYFAGGYSQFDQLCRAAYEEVLPTWTDPVVPWDEIIAARSHTWTADGGLKSEPFGCHTCSTKSVPSRDRMAPKGICPPVNGSTGTEGDSILTL